MSVISLLAVLIGIAIGAVLGFLFARSREASAATGLAARASAAEERARAAGERAALVEGQLAERFQSLSAQALDASTRRFLEMAEGRLDAANAKAAGELDTRRAAVENLVGPLKETLARVEAQLRDSDAERVAVPCRAGRAGAHRAPELGAAQDRDPRAGHRPAPAGGPRPLGRDAAAPGGGAGRDELPLRLR